MAIEISRLPLDTYLTSDGGTVSPEIQKDIVTKWVNAIEPRKTPLLDKVMSNETFEQELHQWGQSYHIALDSKLPSGATSGLNSITVSTGEGEIFQVGMKVFIANPDDDPEVPLYDSSNSETAIITTISGDTLTLNKNLANNYNANALVKAIGTTEELNSEHTEAPYQMGVRLFNYPQRFQAKVTADKRRQNMSDWENANKNPLLKRLQDEVIKQKMLLERTIYYGDRVAGDPSTNTPSQMGGLETFITTNRIDIQGSKLTADILEDVVTELWYNTDDAAGGLLVMSMNTARIWDTILDPDREAGVREVDLTRGIRRYHLRTGTYDIMETRNAPEGKIYIIRPEYIKVKPFKGLNWHFSNRDGSDNAVDHDVKAISGDFTLEVHNEHAMAVLYNFEPRLGQYS